MSYLLLNFYQEQKYLNKDICQAIRSNPATTYAAAIVFRPGLMSCGSHGERTTANSLPNSFETTSEKGLGLRVYIPLIADSRPFVFQNTPTLSTNFSDGDYILFTGFIPGNISEGNPGRLTITFNQPIQDAGTQIVQEGRRR